MTSTSSTLSNGEVNLNLTQTSKRTDHYSRARDEF